MLNFAQEQKLKSKADSRINYFTNKELRYYRVWCELSQVLYTSALLKLIQLCPMLSHYPLPGMNIKFQLAFDLLGYWTLFYNRAKIALNFD